MCQVPVLKIHKRLEISRKSVNLLQFNRQFNPLNSFEEEASYRNRSASVRLQKNYKRVTPSMNIMYEPLGNDIIEPQTFTASKMALRGKAMAFQARFP